MSLSPYRVTLIAKSNDPYNVIPNAPIEIRYRLSNGTSGGLAVIYSDIEGNNLITQAGATTDDRGQLIFYAIAGAYNAVYESQTVPVDTGSAGAAEIKKDPKTLVAGQTTVVFTEILTTSIEVHVDCCLLYEGSDYSITNSTTIELFNSYPVGSVCIGKSVESIKDSPASFVKNYLVLLDCINDTDINNGDVASVAERFAGEGGGGTWDVVLSSGVTVDSFGVVQCVGVPTLALKKRDVVTKYVEQSGNGIGLNFMQQLNADRRDVNLLIQSDSTGDATDEWVYKISNKLAELFPVYSVNYYLWDDTTGNYLAADSLSTGTGAFALDIYNGAKAGSTAQYFTANRKPNVYAGKKFDLIIQNYGHNQTSAGSLNKAIYRLTESVSQLISDNKDTEIAVTLQNIDTSLEDFSALQVQATKEVADLFGLSVIDIRSIFRWKQKTGDLSEWMRDVVHPNDLGQTVWSNAVMDALKSPLKQKQARSNPLDSTVSSLTTNSYIDNWVWTESAPSGWSVTNGTIEKEFVIKETLAWSVKCEGTLASTGAFKQNLNSILNTRKKGTGLLFAARVYVTEGNTNQDAGRVNITSNLGGESSSQYSEVFGEFSWRVVYLESEFLDGATSLSASIFTGVLGDTCYIDRVFCGYSRLPHEPVFIAGTKSDYYDPSNAKAKDTNIITVTDNSVTIDSTSEAFPSWYIDVFGLVPNEQYTMTWTYVGGGTGTVLAREAAGDSGITLKTVTPLSTGTISWNPTLDSGSLQISNSLGTEPFTLNDITITKG